MTCPICNDQYIIATAGPDANGNYDTDDCPCQTQCHCWMPWPDGPGDHQPNCPEATK